MSKLSKLSKIAAFTKGLAAEHRAKDYLLGQGFIFLAHRHKTPWGELDLIMEREGHLIFFEVKYRPTLTEGLWCLRPRHRQRLWHAAEHFLQGNTKIWETIAFDLIVVSKDGALTHVPNILCME